VAHVVLVVEVEASDGELDALSGSKFDSEAVRAAVAVERATAAEDVVGGGKETEEGGAEVAAAWSMEWGREWGREWAESRRGERGSSLVARRQKHWPSFSGKKTKNLSRSFFFVIGLLRLLCT
jgi:hypothetical protein